MTRFDRRKFLATTVLAAGAGTHVFAEEPRRIHIAGQQYPWMTFFLREGKDWNADLPRSLSIFANSGLMGLEPIFNDVAEAERLIPLLRDFRQDMQSLYMNRVLHDPAVAETQIAEAWAVADEAVRTGCQIFVVNPSPIRWGAAEDKSDRQLATQAENLVRLGQGLRKRGLTLAYHHHVVEMRNGAREVRDMLDKTDPQVVSFCFDPHWVYRGSGNSSESVFEFLARYRDRIIELHLRQSQGNVWTETFGPGDIDYTRLANTLADAGRFPHLVLEQAIENGTTVTKTATDAHRESLWKVRKTFAAWGA